MTVVQSELDEFPRCVGLHPRQDQKEKRVNIDDAEIKIRVDAELGRVDADCGRDRAAGLTWMSIVTPTIASSRTSGALSGSNIQEMVRNFRLKYCVIATISVRQTLSGVRVVWLAA